MSLKSDLLKQARFGGRLLVWGPPIDYVARLDGATKYWQLSESIPLEVGDEISFRAAKDAGAATSKQWFASGSGLRINVQANNRIEEVGGDLYLDGSLADNYTTEFPVDGLEHDFKYEITTPDRTLSNLGASDRGFEKLSGYIKKLTIKRNGVVIHEIPLTNRFQGATQLATVGSVNATMLNYTGDEWEVVAPKPKPKPKPAINYVARLDGATQYWQLSGPITAPASTDFTYSAYISGTRTSDIEGIFSDSGGSAWLRALDTGQSQDLQMLIGGSFKGKSYPVGYDLRDGNFNLFKLSRVGGKLSFSINDSGMQSLGTSNAEFSLDNLFRFSNQYFAGVIYRFEVEIGGVLTNSIPLTNKAQGATQLATVGNVNATMVNYTGDEWEAADLKPAINYVARLDGATQYWQLSEPITIPQGGSIEFDLYRPPGLARVNEYVVSGESDTNTAMYFGGKSSLFVGSSGYLTDLTVDGGAVNEAPADGSFYKISAVSTTNLSAVKNLGCRFSFERSALGVFKDLIIRDSQGEITNHIPLTNKAQGATQLATVGNVNATMINYTGDGWEVVDPKPAINYVARLDGATQYWQLSEPITLPANVDYEIGFYASRALDDGNLLYIFGYSGGNNQRQHRLALSSSSPQMAYGMGFIAKYFNFNGNGQFLLTHSGTSKVTSIKFNTYVDAFNDETITIDRLMGPWLGTDGGYLNGYVTDFYVKVNGEEVLRIPLTNKEQGATQLATVGSVNATMINYTGDEWEVP